MLYLDTNFYTALANGKDEAVSMLKGRHELCLPLPVIAELKYGFIKGSQKQNNERILQRFMAQPNVSISMPTIKTTDIYSELQLHCAKTGKVLSHNDLWIAALTKETKGTLVTYDQDFTALKEVMPEMLFILNTR